MTRAPAESRAATELWALLRLVPPSIDALARQGFFSAEYRQRGERRFGLYFNLRWREHGRQCVCYLGRDANPAARVGALLRSLRRDVQRGREVAGQLAALRQQLRALNEELAPHMATRGLHLHGFMARKARSLSSDAMPVTADETSVGEESKKPVSSLIPEGPNHGQ